MSVLSYTLRLETMLRNAQTNFVVILLGCTLVAQPCLQIETKHAEHFWLTRLAVRGRCFLSRASRAWMLSSRTAACVPWTSHRRLLFAQILGFAWSVWDLLFAGVSPARLGRHPGRELAPTPVRPAWGQASARDAFLSTSGRTSPAEQQRLCWSAQAHVLP